MCVTKREKNNTSSDPPSIILCARSLVCVGHCSPPPSSAHSLSPVYLYHHSPHDAQASLLPPTVAFLVRASSASTSARDPSLEVDTLCR